MKKILFFLFSLAFGAAVFILVIRHIGLRETVGVFHSFSLWGGILVIILTLLAVPIGIWRWQLVLRSQGNKVSFNNLKGAYLAGYAVSYLTPIAFLGGELIRGYLVKERTSIPLRKSLASIVVDKVLDLTSTAGIGIIGSFIFLCLTSASIILWALWLAFVCFYSLLFFLFCSDTFNREGVIRRFLRLFNIGKDKNGEALVAIEQDVFSFFGWRRKQMWSGIAIGLLKTGLLWLRCAVLIYFISGSFNPLFSLYALSFYFAATAFFIPASLGSQEALQAFVFGCLGLGAKIGPAFAMLIRGADIVLVLLGLLALAFSGFWFIKNGFLKIIDNLVNNKSNGGNNGS